jgi:transcription elongation factor Elf1
MGLDAGQVLKRAVLCPHCNEDYLFTLRTIANNSELKCPGCGNRISISDSVYEPLVNDVRNVLSAMDSVPTHFMTPNHAEYRSANSSR